MTVSTSKQAAATISAKNTMRQLSAFDQMLGKLQKNMDSFSVSEHSRSNPAAGISSEPEFTPQQKQHVAGLMRINHAGEVSAQALYHGQAAVARKQKLKNHLLAAAEEERDHLRWCAERLKDLDETPSKLDPLWYAGSYAIGALAGLAGDKWSLGFVEETERQVSNHLDEHMQRLPEGDEKSRVILNKMREDEARHGAEAAAAGAQTLPEPVKGVMRAVATVMKTLAYRF